MYREPWEPLGYVMNVPEEEKYLNTKAEIQARIVECVGGRAAEEIVFNSLTTGAANDIEQATKMARARLLSMVCLRSSVWLVWSHQRTST